MPGIMWENRVEPGLKLTAGSVAAVADAAGAASTAWGCSDCCYHCWYTYVQVTGWLRVGRAYYSTVLYIVWKKEDLSALSRIGHNCDLVARPKGENYEVGMYSSIELYDEDEQYSRRAGRNRWHKLLVVGTMHGKRYGKNSHARQASYTPFQSNIGAQRFTATLGNKVWTKRYSSLKIYNIPSPKGIREKDRCSDGIRMKEDLWWDTCT